MTAPHIVDPAGLLGEALSEASPDMMRSLLQTMINALLSADADAVVGAEYGRPSATRTTQRNGTRDKLVTTAAGDLTVKIPKVRTGSFFPALLAPRQRIDVALHAVVMQAYVEGVSTLVGAQCGEHEQPRRCGVPRQVVQQFYARQAGLVQVVEQQQRRSVDSQPAEHRRDGLEGPPDLDLRGSVLDRRLELVDEVGPQAGECCRTRPDQRPQPGRGQRHIGPERPTR